MNPVEQAQAAVVNRQIASLPENVRSAIIAAGLQGARAVLPVPYWSMARFSCTIAANVATVAAGTQAKAFQYAIGQDMQIAGFAAGLVATAAETNLLRAGETLDNADVWIYGLAAELCPNSDAALAALAWRNCSVEISLNGTQSIRLGTLAMFPGAGGLSGAGQSGLILPNQVSPGAGVDGGAGAVISYAANGMPMAGNFLRFPQPFKWCGVGTGGADASLSVITTLQRAISIPLAASRTAVAGGANTPGTAAYTQPTTANASPLDIRWRLVSVSVSRRSVNA